jgi:hypothetical protein
MRPSSESRVVQASQPDGAVALPQGFRADQAQHSLTLPPSPPLSRCAASRSHLAFSLLLLPFHRQFDRDLSRCHFSVILLRAQEASRSICTTTDPSRSLDTRIRSLSRVPPHSSLRGRLSRLRFRTMEPSSKRRRLAPKVPEPPAVSALPPTPQTQAQPPPHAFPQDQVRRIALLHAADGRFDTNKLPRSRHNTTRIPNLSHGSPSAMSSRRSPGTSRMPPSTSSSRP